ncbi:MAG: CDP-alcohol phosphatidyltransferase family protein [Alistipes sp.]|nr:CDP-alcohol phosphatidyltransferase family protein [Alistipes sp.]
MKIKLFTVPNLLTSMNLLCGAVGVVVALTRGALSGAFAFMAAAAAFDFFDGFAARLLRQSSPIGGELDSLADDISFGLLPSVILYVLYGRMPALWMPAGTGAEIAAFGVFVVAVFAALRLAKFNIDDTQHTEFCGLPSPAAALLCGSLGLLAECNGLTMPREAVLLVAVLVAALMISPIRMFSLKFEGFGWKGNELRYAFLLLCVVLLATLQVRAIPVVLVAYVAISTLRWWILRKTDE